MSGRVKRHAVTRPFLALLLAAAAAAAARASCKTDAPPAPFEIPAGFHLADAPPTAEQLEFKNAEGEKLVGEYVMFNWATAGWCVGEIVRTNTDGRRTIERGVPANFFVYYEIDDAVLQFYREVRFEINYQGTNLPASHFIPVNLPLSPKASREGPRVVRSPEIASVGPKFSQNW